MQNQGSKIFREEALLRLSSPEQLDKLMRVVSPQTWLPLVSMGCLVVAAGVWSVVGRIPLTVTGTGVLIRPRNVVQFQAPSAGQLLSLNIKPGDRVKLGQTIETLKASGLESDAFAKFAGYYAKALNMTQELGLQSQVLTILPALLTAVATTAILVVGGLKVMDGDLSIGMLVAYQSLMASFSEPVNSLVNFGSTLQDLEADLNRLDDVLQNPVDAEVERVAGDNRVWLTSPPAPLLQGEGSKTPPFPTREGGLGGLGLPYPNNMGRETAG